MVPKLLNLSLELNPARNTYLTSDKLSFYSQVTANLNHSQISYCVCVCSAIRQVQSYDHLAMAHTSSIVYAILDSIQHPYSPSSWEPLALDFPFHNICQQITMS